MQQHPVSGITYPKHFFSLILITASAFTLFQTCQPDVPSFRLPTVGSRVFPIAGLLVLRSGIANQMMSPPLRPCQPSGAI